MRTTMKIGELVAQLPVRLLTGDAEREITGVYACDLLSWVISHAAVGDAWITVMNNLNIIAVAALTDLACIVIPEGVEVDSSVLERAREQEVAILSAELSAAELAVRINAIGCFYG